MQHALKLSILVFSIILLHLVMSGVSSEEKSAASSRMNAAAAEEGFSEARTFDADIKLKEGKQLLKKCNR
jgi:hypothetical protein